MTNTVSTSRHSLVLKHKENMNCYFNVVNKLEFLNNSLIMDVKLSIDGSEILEDNQLS
jgi:hypothetical protein